MFANPEKEIENNEVHNYSPEILENPQGVMKKLELLQKSDLFSLGVVFLQAAILEPMSDIYQFSPGLNINIDKLKSKLQGFNNMSNYSKMFKQLLNKLLAINPHERSTAKEILQQFWSKQSVFLSKPN